MRKYRTQLVTWGATPTLPVPVMLIRHGTYLLWVFFCILDPGSEFFPSWIRVKEFDILTQKMEKMVSKLWKILFGLFIPDPDFLPILDPEVKRAPDPGSVTLIFDVYDVVLNLLPLPSVCVPSVHRHVWNTAEGNNGPVPARQDALRTR